MRLFSWYGLAAVMTAACCGYLAGVGHRPRAAIAPLPPIPSHEEEATPPPTPPPGFAANTEVIDLTCPPHATTPFDAFLQTVEPPIAEPSVHQATFEFPAEGPTLPPVMPYLDDQPSVACRDRAEPSQRVGDGSLLPCGSSCGKSARTATEIAFGVGLWTYTPPR